ncbi:AAA family ATPase [Streptomyces sp. NPDC052013]|uniref:AAA family ATPase n=1 Tax=Streptomyces sp. NPDC052013 TaxID=3365679 RepID=UPI0037D3F3B7
MLTVMLGGAPGVGKTTVAGRLLELAHDGPRLVQWVDVDALWLHQPWRVDERMRTMVQANLRAVAGNASQAQVDILLITWVFQSAEIHRLVTGLLPAGTTTVSVQLRADHDTWIRRFEADPMRPGVNDFYQGRYAAAQGTPVDHVVETDGLTPMDVARQVAALIGLAEQGESVAHRPGPARHRM